MTRIAALVAGLLLIAGTSWWLVDLSVPVPKYRKGGFTDFLILGQLLFSIHGSVLLGVAVAWVRANRSGQPFLPIEVFKAGMFGVVTACTVFFVGGSIYGLAKYGSFDKVIGNLWGVMAIFWVVLGALVSAGIALLFYAWRGPAGPPSRGPWSSPPTVSP